MRTNTLSLFAGSIFLTSALVVAAAPKPRTAASASAGLRSVMAASGLIFEPNLGQAPGDAAFVARGRRHSVSLKPDRMTMRFARAGEQDLIQVDMEVVNADPAAKGEGQEPLASKTNYYVGNDPAKWRTGVPNFKQVAFTDVYEGVDVVYHPAADDAGATELEYDFIVAPGVDPDVIQLRFSGHEGISIDPSGDLVLTTGAGELRHGRPVVYQRIDGVRHEIAGRYRLSNTGTLGFTVGDYDHTQPLVIDPKIRDAQYVGGLDDDIITGIEDCGELDLTVIAGHTKSLGLLDGEGAVNGAAMFVAFFNNNALAGTPLTLANYTILDGNGDDQANAIAVDSHCDVYGVGVSNSTDLPVTDGSDNPADLGAIVWTYDSEGKLEILQWAGGDGADNLRSIDLLEIRGADDEKLVMVAQAGQTFSMNLPVPEGNEYSGGSDVFSRISVFGRQGGTLTERASTTWYHGGSGEDDDAAIRFLNGKSNPDSTFDFTFALGMSTNSDDIWEAEDVREGPFGERDGALAIYEGIQWSDSEPITVQDATYIGGAGNEFFSDLSVRRAIAHLINESTIDAILNGESIENAGYDPVRHGPGGGQDVYLVSYEYDPELALALLDEAGWVAGGEEADAVLGCDLDPNDCLACAGVSLSDGTFPITEGAPFPEFSGLVAGFVSRVCGDQLDLSTWVPATEQVLLTDLAVDGLGQIYVAGFATEGFPATPNSPDYGGAGDGLFIAFEGPFFTNEGVVNSASFTQFVFDPPPFELRE